MDAVEPTPSGVNTSTQLHKLSGVDPENDTLLHLCSSSSERPTFCTRTLLLKIHCIVGMPSAMAQIDPMEGYFELVIQPKCKYYSNGHRLMSRELTKQVIGFSPSSISVCRDRCTVDFDSLYNLNDSSPAGGRDIVDHSMSLFECSSTQIGDKDPPGVSYSGGDPSAHQSPSKDAPNHFLLQFPTREDLKVIIDVCIGMRQVHTQFLSSRWLTPTIEGEMSNIDLFSMFLVSDGEVARHKIVCRSVGFQLGHVSCTVSLPNVQNDLTQLSNREHFIPAASRRLEHDVQMLNLLYPSRSGRLFAQQTTRALFSQRLSRGESELVIYKTLLHQYAPNFYLSRVQDILCTYPPKSHNAKWVRNSTAEGLLKEFKSREEELIRMLCLELGPDKSSISPRMRYRVFLMNTKLSEADVWKHIRDKWGKQTESNILDFEPDVFMAELERHYGLKETSQTHYNFSKVWYPADERIYFRDVLRFPSNSSEGRYRTQVLASRNQRVPLLMTPNERPLQPLDPHSRSTTEIEILLDKYKPEFLQIIPSIAEAMNAVVCGNEYLSNCISQNIQKHQWHHIEGNEQKIYNAFSVFNSTGRCEPYTAFLSHISEFTYISPSVLVAAVIYIDRLCSRYQKLIISRHNIEKLFISALRVAIKVVDLRSLNNHNFAQACSLSTKELNVMEEWMLKLMNMDFFLSGDELYRYVRLLDPPLRRNLVPSPLDINLPVLRHSSSSTNISSPIRAKTDRQSSSQLPEPISYPCSTHGHLRTRSSFIVNGHEAPPPRTSHSSGGINGLASLPVPHTQPRVVHQSGYHLTGQ
ncbi:unnamed protein product [Phytomonas sp. Hart1]|nr:unnamed protein product [Phytomonas sp. Hart1]|eukprot:CCW65946.1 unnamed protein product [Phytomonas sp. isolate Hart1]